MEKFKTKNLILASFIAIAMMFVAMFGFAACGPKGEGEQQLTNADVVGVWYSTRVVITGETGEDAYLNGTYTNDRYLALKAIDEGTERDLTSAEQTEYYTLKGTSVKSGILQNYKLEAGEGTEKGKVYSKGIAQENYVETATWEIANNVVEITAKDGNGVSSITWARDNDLAIITVSFADGSVYTFTLAKVAAE